MEATSALRQIDRRWQFLHSASASISSEDHEQSAELVAGAIEQLDRLSKVITTSLDVAEADSRALRLRLELSDIGELVEPSETSIETSGGHDQDRSVAEVFQDQPWRHVSMA
jgi:K+-sensing histidine kinase KdpD